MQNQNSERPQKDLATYFPYFSHSLFIEEAEFSKENDSQIDSQISDESSTNTTHSSINSLEEEEKLIPLNLLDVSPVKSASNKDKEFDLFQKNLLDLFEEKEKQEIGKIKPELQKFILPKSLFDNTKNKKKQFSDDLNEDKLKAKPYIPSKYKLNKSFALINPADCFNSLIKKPNKSNNLVQFEICFKTKKKKFVERKGDWKCSKCKNINFAFREKCNKCKITKEESDNYQEIFQNIDDSSTNYK